jgi:hypothetical protein
MFESKLENQNYKNKSYGIEMRIACNGTDALAYLSNESTIQENNFVQYGLELITVDCVLCQRSIFESN